MYSAYFILLLIHISAIYNNFGRALNSLEKIKIKDFIDMIDDGDYYVFY
jgi:hypothetical protein